MKSVLKLVHAIVDLLKRLFIQHGVKSLGTTHLITIVTRARLRQFT